MRNTITLGARPVRRTTGIVTICHDSGPYRVRIAVDKTDQWTLTTERGTVRICSSDRHSCLTRFRALLDRAFGAPEIPSATLRSNWMDEMSGARIRALLDDDPEHGTIPPDPPFTPNEHDNIASPETIRRLSNFVFKCGLSVDGPWEGDPLCTYSPIEDRRADTLRRKDRPFYSKD